MNATIVLCGSRILRYRCYVAFVLQILCSVGIVTSEVLASNCAPDGTDGGKNTTMSTLRLFLQAQVVLDNNVLERILEGKQEFAQTIRRGKPTRKQKAQFTMVACSPDHPVMVLSYMQRK